MADHAIENVDVFVYQGGQAPQHITHARIDESIEVIEDYAFVECENLVHVETHNRIRKIGESAFCGCKSLPRIDIKSVVEICRSGFDGCEKLQFVEFGDKLETIGRYAFRGCPIEQLKLLSVVSVDVEFSEKLERVSSWAFNNCQSLQRIAIPLKRNLVVDGTVFVVCKQLTRVDLVGGVQQTVSSLHMKSWRTEMNTEINRVNLLLPDAASIVKAVIIRDWMDSVIDRLEHYKAEHANYVKEAMTLLELALWKAKLAEKDYIFEESATKEVKIEVDHDARLGKRVTCGADTMIKNVLPFLQLLE